MMRTYLVIFGIIFILLTLTLRFSFSHSTNQSTPNGLTITGKDNNGKVQIALKGILTLKLGAIPGTGYSWQVVRNNPELLQWSGNSIFVPIVEDKIKELLGAPEYQVFRFKAQGSGTNVLELHYIRKWEKKVKPLKTFSITVIVH